MKVIEKKDGMLNITLTQEELAELRGYMDMTELKGMHRSLRKALEDDLMDTTISLEYIKEK